REAAAVPGVTVVRLAVGATTVRWFFLIVLYGVFIPNTWRRCAIMVGFGAAVPPLLTAAAAWAHGRLDGEMGAALAPQAIFLATGAAGARFGSHRLYVLQEQADEARQLGQYRLRRKLGSGGMGEVYLAEHLLLRRPCAVKLIRPDQAGDPNNLRRFESEV